MTPAQDFQGKSTRPARAALLFMPFASIEIPSLAISLLKPLAESAGAPCDIWHLHLPFRSRAVEAYDLFNEASVSQVLGQRPFEWVFSAALFGDEWAATERAGADNLMANLGVDLESGLTEGVAADPCPYEMEALLELRAAVPSFMDWCMSVIPFDGYDMVGFSITFAQVTASLALAREIKSRFPDKRIALGGFHCSGSMGPALMRLFPFVDMVFDGEADISFPQALQRLQEKKSLDGIAGVTFRRDKEIVEQGTGERIDLDSTPCPDFIDYLESLKLYAPDVLDSEQAHLMVEFSRGCWWARRSKCLFCGDSAVLEHYRHKSPSRAAEELKELAENHDIRVVGVADSLFPDRYFKTLLPALTKEPILEVRFMFMRTNLSRRRVELLKSAGIHGILPGIESLDSEIHQLMRKGTNLLQVLALLKWCREYDVSVHWFLLYGVPGETAPAYERMAGLVPSIYHLTPPHDCRPVRLFRFSPLFEEISAEALEPIPISRAIYPFDDEDIVELSSCFDWHYQESAAAAGAVDTCLVEIQKWMSLWNGERPLLLFKKQPDGSLKIYDTRPPRGKTVRTLEGAAAAAYLACDSPASLDRIAATVKEQMPGSYPGDASLRQSLDELVEGRLLVGENDRYLALANDLDIMKEHSLEFPVQILGME